MASPHYVHSVHNTVQPVGARMAADEDHLENLMSHLGKDDLSFFSFSFIKFTSVSFRSCELLRMLKITFRFVYNFSVVRLIYFSCILSTSNLI